MLYFLSTWNNKKSVFLHFQLQNISTRKSPWIIKWLVQYFSFRIFNYHVALFWNDTIIILLSSIISQILHEKCFDKIAIYMLSVCAFFFTKTKSFVAKIPMKLMLPLIPMKLMLPFYIYLFVAKIPMKLLLPFYTVAFLQYDQKKSPPKIIDWCYLRSTLCNFF